MICDHSHEESLNSLVLELLTAVRVGRRHLGSRPAMFYVYEVRKRKSNTSCEAIVHSTVNIVDCALRHPGTLTSGHVVIIVCF